jgi:hypothetical protein
LEHAEQAAFHEASCSSKLAAEKTAAEEALLKEQRAQQVWP